MNDVIITSSMLCIKKRIIVKLNAYLVAVRNLSKNFISVDHVSSILGRSINNNFKEGT